MMSSDDLDKIAMESNPPPVTQPQTDSTPILSASGEEICRDYIRNSCFRGATCRYKHCPLDDESTTSTLAPSDSTSPTGSGGGGMELTNHSSVFQANGRTYTFCHDYLNSVCKRKICKYIHCSKEEEDLYRKTGILPERLKFLAENGLSVLANMHSIPQEVPVCRDYQRGFCERGDQCKFLHVLENISPAEQQKAVKRASAEPEAMQLASSPKLTKIEQLSPAPPETPEQENERLREKLDLFSRQIEDLTARNQALILQNSKLKAQEEALKTNLNFLALNQLTNLNPAGAQIPPKMAAPLLMQPAAAAANKILYQQMAYNSALLTNAASAANFGGASNYYPITFIPPGGGGSGGGINIYQDASLMEDFQK